MRADDEPGEAFGKLALVSEQNSFMTRKQFRGTFGSHQSQKCQSGPAFISFARLQLFDGVGPQLIIVLFSEMTKSEFDAAFEPESGRTRTR